MRWNFVGSIFGSSGYASHCKGLVNALHKLGHEIKIECELPPAWELHCNDAELTMIKNPWFNDGITVMIAQPQYWPLYWNKPCKKFVGFVVWEGDKIPEYWFKYFGTHTILVPSQHVKDAIENSRGSSVVPYKDNIFIVPHGVDTDLFKPTKKSSKKPFVYVCNKGWNRGMKDRGGLQFVLKAFHEEFKNETEEQVMLKVKVNPAYGKGLDFVEECKKIGVSDNPKILLNSEDLDYKELPKIYEDGDVFVSASMGEAFNLPVLEAMSCGLPAIHSGFGGEKDYAVGWELPFKLFENDYLVEYEGVCWGLVDIKILREAMRDYFQFDDITLKAQGRTSREIALDYTWKSSAEKLIKAVNN